MKRRFLAALLCCVIVMLAGCGGGGGGSAASSVRTATITLKIAIPGSARALLANSAAHATTGWKGRAGTQRLIPSNTATVQVVYKTLDSSGNPVDVPTPVTATPSGSNYTATLSKFVEGAPNLVTVVAYDGLSVPVAAKTVTVNISPASTPALDITLQSTVVSNGTINLSDTDKTLLTSTVFTETGRAVGDGHTHSWTVTNFATTYTDRQGTTTPGVSTPDLTKGASYTWMPAPGAQMVIKAVTPSSTGAFDFKVVKPGATSVTLVYTDNQQVVRTQSIPVTATNPNLPGVTTTSAPVKVGAANVTTANAYDVSGDFTNGNANVALDESTNGLVALFNTVPTEQALPQVSPAQFNLTLTGVGANTFTLSYNGQTTGSIAGNATAATVQAALTGLPTIGLSNAMVTGANPNLVVTLIGARTGTTLPLTGIGTGLTSLTRPTLYTGAGTRLAYSPQQSAWAVMKGDGSQINAVKAPFSVFWTQTAAGQTPAITKFLDLDTKRFGGNDFVYTLEQSGASAYQVANRSSNNGTPVMNGTIALNSLGFTPTNLAVLLTTDQNNNTETDFYISGATQVAKVTVVNGVVQVNASFITGITPADIATSSADTRFLFVLDSATKKVTAYSTADGSLVNATSGLANVAASSRLAVADDGMGGVYIHVLDATGGNAQIESFKLP